MKRGSSIPQKRKYVRREVRKLNIIQQIQDLRELYDACDPDMDDDQRVLEDHISTDQEAMDALMTPAVNPP